MQLSWGVVGLGYIVGTTMAPAIAGDPRSRVVAGVSRDQRRVDEFARRFDVPYAYTSYDEMLANPEVDAVFIGTPNSLHRGQVIAAARAGKHVLCDKPIATTYAGAIDEVRACNEAGVRFGVNFHNRFLSWVARIKEVIASGAIGDVLSIEAQAGAGVRVPADWKNDREMAGLGTVFHQGVHVLDLLRYVMDDEPVEVVALFDEPQRYNVETHALVLLRFGSGELVFVDCDQRVPHPRNDIVVHGTRGRIVGEHITRRGTPGVLHVLTEQGEETTDHPQPSGASHQAVVSAFSSWVLGGAKDQLATGLDGAHSMMLCDAIAESVRERRVVTLDHSELAELRRSLEER